MYSVHKCTILCARIIVIIVWFYNISLLQNYYSKRWINLVEITLEKGKGPILGKLRNITLIEGDLQINIRICLNAKSEELIEKIIDFQLQTLAQGKIMQ